ncbi:MAG: MFS transporter [SAR86 cluster bacterium]|uniref:MFS transporter n=1 Tax=SAR86 cluster bacterium TaxID=2030880 RepID=A0A2A5CG68_9GAMM|nr:MAG: MFS transporter [SAR86 cluster bacterium]
MLPFLNRNLSLLTVCVCIMMSCASLIVTTAALVGFSLATDKSLATLPIASQFIGAMLASIPAAMLMQLLGRKITFMLAALFGIGGGIMGYLAIMNHQFWLFVLATFSVGIFQGFANYMRYAAAETVAPPDKSKAISFVMLGGVAAAVIGPNLAKYSREWVQGAEFAGSYASVIGLYIIILLVFSFLKLEEKTTSVHIDKDGKRKRDTGRSLRKIAKQPRYIVALISGMLGYSVMSFVMTATPLAMNQSAFLFNDTALVIQWHVLAMFAPSFVTGNLIARFGVIKILFSGVVFGFLCISINLLGTTFWHFLIALMCLGISWNFLFVGSTSMITDTYEEKEKNKAQALNDFSVFSMVAVASLSAGALQNAFGWQVVNIGALPLLLVILFALIWLVKKNRSDNASTLEIDKVSSLPSAN